MTQRLSVNINDETAAALEDLAERRGTSITDIVRRAVSVYKFVEDMVASGKTVRVADDDSITDLELQPPPPSEE